MKKLLSTAYTETSLNIAMFLLRAGLGVLLLPHGFEKLVHFNEMKSKFFNLLGMGSTVSLILVIFAELVCAILLILGLLSRGAALVIFFQFCVIVWKVNQFGIFGKGEDDFLFLLISFVLVLVGPGKFSIDRAMGK